MGSGIRAEVLSNQFDRIAFVFGGVVAEVGDDLENVGGPCGRRLWCGVVSHHGDYSSGHS
jgi:hypothetical protein